MRIIQISDSHIANDIPQRLTDLDTCIEAINQLPAPDLVIHTGDITHNGLESEYASARKSLDNLNAPYCVLAGNKDDRTCLQLAFNDHNYLTQHETFVQYSIEQYPTRLLILDTVCETDTKGELCKARLQHLQQMLEHNTAKPAVIFMHHSPYIVEEIPDPQQFHDWSQVDKLAELLSRFTNVQGVYCGHVHRNVEGNIGKLPVSVLSCMATDLRKGKLSEEEKTRPMYRELTFS